MKLFYHRNSSNKSRLLSSSNEPQIVNEPSNSSHSFTLPRPIPSTTYYLLPTNKGFSAVELLITLFIAAAFMISGYQLYAVVIKDGGEARMNARAANVATDYLQRYKSSATIPCTVQTPLPEAAPSPAISGLSNTTVSVAISCPYSSSTSVSKVLVTFKYGTPQQTITNSTFVSTTIATTSRCPTGFIPIPGSATYGTSDFCVMKYEAKILGNDVGNQVYSSSFVPDTRATGTPWININQINAIAEAQTYPNCTNCHLITEAEWLTIVQNVLSVPSNWNGGVVGTSYIYSGHNDSVPNNSLAAAADNDPYNGTGQTSPSNQKRTLILSNSEVIWDLAGNVNELTSGTSTTGQPGVIGNAYASWIQWPDVTTLGTLSPNVFPSGTGITGANTWTGTNGIGKLISNSAETALRGFIRSGDWGDSVSVGVLLLNLTSSPSDVRTDLGFRVTAPKGYY